MEINHCLDEEKSGLVQHQELHTQVVERNKQFKSEPRCGFVKPNLVPIMDAIGEITDITVEQPENFVIQMLDYADRFGNLNK